MKQLRIISDEEFAAIMKKASQQTMTKEEREAQRISFVWGNDVEGKSTITSVRKHLLLD